MKKEKQKLHAGADNVSLTQEQHIEFSRKIIISSTISVFPKHFTMLSDIWLHHLVMGICRNCKSCIGTPWNEYKEQSSKWCSSSPELTLYSIELKLHLLVNQLPVNVWRRKKSDLGGSAVLQLRDEQKEEEEKHSWELHMAHLPLWA